jgi:hypothetical protein
MGTKIFDQYTYLHFAVGIIVYFWGISILNLFILHSIFEILENTQMGMKLINNYIVFWPGGKSQSDSIINVIGDTIGVIIGWSSAYYLDQIGNKYKWFTLHISP